MGKASEPPMCKACGKAHWGTCVDHETRGYLSSRLSTASPQVREQRIAKATEVLATTRSKSPRGTPKRQEPKGLGRGEVAASAPTTSNPNPSPKPRKRRMTEAEKKKARGRPKTVEDRKAYLAQKARERRAKKKAERESTT
jgi:hypothetical protein